EGAARPCWCRPGSPRTATALLRERVRPSPGWVWGGNRSGSWMPPSGSRNREDRRQSGHGIRPQLVEHRQKFRRIGTLCVVRIHLRIGDDAIGADDVPRGHRQYPGRIIVDRRQVVLEALVEFDKVVRQRKPQPEGRGDATLLIAQDGKGQMMLALGLAAVGRRLGRDGDEAGTTSLDLRPCHLKGLQFQIAVGAPGTTIERYDQRALRQKLRGGNPMTVGILECEFRCLVTRLPGVERLASSDQLRRGAVYGVEYIRAGFVSELSAFEIRLEGVQTILKRHGAQFPGG